MQIYRELGLYDAMVAESAKHYDRHAGIVDVESLAGKFRRTFMADMNEGVEDISPCNRLFLTQQMFEPMLRRRVVEGGVGELGFSTEMVDFRADAEGVTALVRRVDTGEKRLVRARYMVACDGNRSRVREMLGIKMRGRGLLSHSVTIYFEMDVGRYVKGKYNGVIYVNNPEIRGFFRLDKNGREGFLVVFTAGEQGTEASRFPADGITDEKARGMLRSAIGADIEFEVTLVAKWQAVCDTAERFVDPTGRVILAGDSAATVTPHGGFGGNTGVQSVHNLAWKLAAVLNGKAGDDLVSKSYEEERWPVGHKTVEQVFERYIKRSAPEMREDIEKRGGTIEEPVPEPWLELGYRYHSQALDTESLGEVNENPSTAKALPGSMAHHVMITLAGDDTEAKAEIPIADLLGTHFVLVLGSEASGWEQASRDLQLEKHFPVIDVHGLAPGTDESFCAKYDISTKGTVLIRPDGFVVWSSSGPAIFDRAAMGSPDPSRTLVCIMEKALCLKSNGEVKRGTEHLSEQPDKKLRQPPATLAEALFVRETALLGEKERLQTQMEQVDKQLEDVRKMGNLQNEMAMLGMKMLPLQDKPPEYSLDDCLGGKKDNRT